LTKQTHGALIALEMCPQLGAQNGCHYTESFPQAWYDLAFGFKKELKAVDARSRKILER
jgi:hypothetical protein